MGENEFPLEQPVIVSVLNGISPGKEVSGVFAIDLFDIDLPGGNSVDRVLNPIDVSESGRFTLEKYLRFTISGIPSGSSGVYENFRVWADGDSELSAYSKIDIDYAAPVVRVDVDGFDQLYQYSDRYLNYLEVPGELEGHGDYTDFVVCVYSGSPSSAPGQRNIDMYFGYDGYGQLSMMRFNGDLYDEIGVDIPSSESVLYVTGADSREAGAVYVYNGGWIKKQVPGNIRTDVGSICFYVQSPGVSANDVSTDRYYFYLEDVFKAYFDSALKEYVFSVYNGSSWVSASSEAQSFVSGEWQHVSFVWDCDSGLSIYVDGQLSGSLSVTWSNKKDVDGVFWIGNSPGGYCSNSYFDDFVIYNNVISVSDLARLINFDRHRTVIDSQDDFIITTQDEGGDSFDIGVM